MLDSDPRKGHIPSIISTSGVYLCILRDSKYWCQSISKPSSTATSLHASAPHIRPPPPPSDSATTAPLHMATMDDSIIDGEGAIVDNSTLHPPSSRSTQIRPHSSNQLTPLPVHMHKHLRDWPEDCEQSSHQCPLPPIATGEPLPSTSRVQDASIGDRDITPWQPSSDLGNNGLDPMQQQMGIDTYIRSVHPSSARNGAAAIRNGSQTCPAADWWGQWPAGPGSSHRYPSRLNLQTGPPTVQGYSQPQSHRRPHMI